MEGVKGPFQVPHGAILEEEEKLRTRGTISAVESGLWEIGPDRNWIGLEILSQLMRCPGIVTCEECGDEVSR